MVKFNQLQVTFIVVCGCHINIVAYICIFDNVFHAVFYVFFDPMTLFYCDATGDVDVG